MFALSGDAVTFPIGRNASGVDPHFGVGDFSEEPIEDEEFEEPQEAEGRDVGPDDQDGPSQMVKMVRIGEVLRQRSREQSEEDARY